MTARSDGFHRPSRPRAPQPVTWPHAGLQNRPSHADPDDPAWAEVVEWFGQWQENQEWMLLLAELAPRFDRRSGLCMG